MKVVPDGALGILDRDRVDDREALLDMLVEAYWMEIETVMNYVASSVNPDGLRAQEVIEALAGDIDEELEHARTFARRIKDLYGVVPGSEAFIPRQSELQPPGKQTDLLHVVEGVVAAERGAIRHYEQIIALAGDIDPVTQDIAVEILGDEQRHLRLFESFRRELAG